MLLYTLIFGEDVPGGLFLKLYLLLSCMLILSELMRSSARSPKNCLLWTLGIGASGAMLSISLVGAVWYEAQMLAFLFAISAIIAMRRRHPTLSCLCYALAIGCRPFSALLAPGLACIFIHGERQRGTSAKHIIRRILPGLAVGLLIAGAYAWYNYIRFDNPFEFGHNYLPEFMREENGQFSIQYLLPNLKTLFFGKVLSSGGFSTDGYVLYLEGFGFSMFVSCPLLLVNAVWFVRDLFRHKMSLSKLLLALSGAANCIALCLHRTLGGQQFGMRYAMELIPLCLMYFLLDTDRERPGMRRWEASLLSMGLVLNFFGGIVIHV